MPMPSFMWKFLDSEKLVMLGLTEDATRTDAQIADLFGLKKGTVAAARRRLLDAGAIDFVNVPAFNKLGCELLAVHIGTTEAIERADTRVNHYLDFCAQRPELFHGLIGGTSVVMFTVLRNATELDVFVQAHNRFFSGPRRPSKARLSTIIFPFALSKITMVPNFAPVVHRYFQLEVPPPRPVYPSLTEVSEPDLSPTERACMVALVEHPRASDREIGAIVKLSRQAVTRTRNKLQEEGLVIPACIPRLHRWGFEICAVVHSRFNMEVQWEKRLRSQPRAPVEFSYFTLSKADESITNYYIARFGEYSEQLESALAWYHKVKVFEEPPEITLFALERSNELRTFEYGPAVRRLLLP